MQKVLHLVFAIVVVAGDAKFRFFFFVVSFKVFARVAEFRARLKDRFVEVQKRRSKKHGLSSGGFQKLGMRFDDVVRGGGRRKYLALHRGPVRLDDFRRRVVQDILNQTDCSLCGPVRGVGVNEDISREKVLLCGILVLHSRRRLLLLPPVHFLVKPTKRRPRFAHFLFHHFRAEQVFEQRLILGNGTL